MTPMTDDDIILSWADRPDDRPRVRDEGRAVRIVDSIATLIVFLAYEGVLIASGMADGGEGATQAAGMSAPQSDVIIFATLGLMGLLASWALVALVRAIRR